MTGIENLLFIDRGGIIWDRGGNFSKFIDRGTSHWGTWTEFYYGKVDFIFFSSLHHEFFIT